VTVAEPTLAPELEEKYGGAVRREEGLDQPTWVVSREVLAELARDLRDHPSTRFDLLLDLCGVDYPDRERRF
jgi:NADH-quinone oxidoreductase subunit C